ncbi:MAG TPA: GDSL-type esterase/lipase family protein [Gemmataceae bacterium]|nr:GDSL-type esterase/lipase family protein [Gemmataceae bacterium]
MSRKLKCTFCGLVLLLLGSLGLNVLLYREALEQYRAVQLAHLDPTCEAEFAPGKADPAALEPGQVRIVFAGDSSIARWEELPKLPGCQMVNRGCGGETTAQLRLRLERDVFRLQPAVVVLEVGGNDLKAIGVLPEQERGIIDTCQRNRELIVKELRQRGIPVVLSTIFPVGKVPLSRRPVWSDRSLAAWDEVNQATHALDVPGVTIFDSYKILAKDGRTNPDYEQDMLHITSKGYEVLNEAIRPVLEKVLKERRQ